MLVSRYLPLTFPVRFYASKVVSNTPKAIPERVKTGALRQQVAPRSSCPPNTVLVGLNYLKDQPPVLALSDEEYPPWLWKLLDKSELPDDGPGGTAEKRRLRKENRQRIRDQNFMKTQ
ncbi:mitochondrial ribosomal protein L37-domain-containing protein [Multifurca ochricompacta]|uniref:Large ribosomal subunit protein mL54 n=1 Tax=Multifurca ochricompacta TaxID=376703 RepID=A0AAD4MCH6_9AGAM|nr:mitochondrial ribosomal protein L37-domain-containing protein [Multifurca ochricompacta]